MKNKTENFMRLDFPSRSCNESFSRAAVAAFASQLDMNIEELADIKTAVSEAVTNSIVHGYRGIKGIIHIECHISGSSITVTVRDEGRGIEDVERAMQPLFTTDREGERSGMGFTVMQTFMDKLSVDSVYGEGTTVTMTKTIGGEADDDLGEI